VAADCGIETIAKLAAWRLLYILVDGS